MYGLIIQISFEDHKIKDSNQNITIDQPTYLWEIFQIKQYPVYVFTLTSVIINNFSVAKR